MPGTITLAKNLLLEWSVTGTGGEHTTASFLNHYSFQLYAYTQTKYSFHPLPMQVLLQ